MRTLLERTPLYDFHVSRMARMGPFAGYDMPIHYPLGVVNEHLHTRRAAGLFDVSHVGFFEVRGADRNKFFEWVTPSGVSEMEEGRSALTLFMNESGGVKDDCIVSQCSDHLLGVVNAGCKAKIMPYLHDKVAEFKGDATVVDLDRAMVTLQGPKVASVMSPLVEDLEKMTFMDCRRNVKIKGIDISLVRCGYSGEDGFDIIMGKEDVVPFVELLLENPDVQLAGLAARDTLRTEAGLCLYSHELTESVNPVAARLMWCIPKRRMAEGGFIGHEQLQQFVRRPKELVPRVRMGIISVAKGPVPRTGMQILVDNEVVGEVTSGVPSPTLSRNIAMGFINRKEARVGQQVELDVRGKRVPGEVTMPRFVPLRYYKG